MQFAINFWAVLVSAIVSYSIGSLWYSPMLFGNVWAYYMGITPEKMKGAGMGKIYVGSFIATLVMAYVLAHFIIVGGAGNIASGAEIAFWIWLGFVATIALGSIFWENKAKKLYLINVGYQLVSLTVMGIILALWR